MCCLWLHMQDNDYEAMFADAERFADVFERKAALAAAEQHLQVSGTGQHANITALLAGAAVLCGTVTCVSISQPRLGHAYCRLGLYMCLWLLISLWSPILIPFNLI